MRAGAREVAGDRRGVVEGVMWVAHPGYIPRDQRGPRHGVRADQAPVADLVPAGTDVRVGSDDAPGTLRGRRGGQAGVVHLDVVVDERVCVPGCCCAIDRQYRPTGEGSRIQRVHEDLPVVPENAQIDNHRGESEDHDHDQFKEDEDLPVLSLAVPS